MPDILTSSFFDSVERAGRISIARWQPQDAGDFKQYPALAPRAWFRSVDRPEYEDRYLDQLYRLDPQQVVADLRVLAGDGVTPVLCCRERRWQIEAGRAWCHRRLVATWLKAELGIEIAEL
jgi:uncharacterized protein (DUF488 family)